VPAIGGSGLTSSITSPIIQTILSAFGIGDLKDLVQRVALIMLGTALLLIGIFKFTEPGKAVIEKITVQPEEAAKVASAAAVVA
jgi:hypothetical protein